MKYLLPLLVLLLTACPNAANNVPRAKAETQVSQTVHERLIAALEKGNGKTLTRGQVAQAWRSVTDEEWARWDTNKDDVLDRGEIARLTEERQ